MSRGYLQWKNAIIMYLFIVLDIVRGEFIQIILPVLCLHLTQKSLQ